MRIRLGGRRPVDAALRLHLACEATKKLVDDPPDLSRAQRKIVRPRFRSLVDETKVLAPLVAAAIASYRNRFLARVGIREAADDSFDADAFEQAIDAISTETLRVALATMYDALYAKGVAHVRIEVPEEFDLVPTRALAALRTFAFDFATQVADDEKEALRELIATALHDGLDIIALKREIAIFFEDGLHRIDRNGNERVVDVDDWSMMVARTETARAQNAGSLDAYRAAKVEYLIWIAAEDERTCPLCRAADRKVAEIGTVFPVVDVEAGPAHPNCFPSGTMVTGESVFRAASVRDYVGDLVCIRLRSGHELAATPNHPIAARRGWVPISSLRKGDHIFYRAREKAASTDPNDQHVESRIEQVADAFTVSSAAMPTAAEDFHGDGAGSDVHVVRTDCKLLNDRKICGAHRGGESDLITRDVRLHSLHGARVVCSLLWRAFRAAHGIVRRTGASLARPWASLRRLNPVGLASAAYRDAGGAQSLANDVPRGLERARERKLAFASAVSAHDFPGVERDDLRSQRDTPFAKTTSDDVYTDPAFFREGRHRNALLIATSDVVSVERYAWSGHVYNLESENGWFFANGIVAHNCRCTVIGYNEITKDLVAEEDRPE